MPLLASRRLLPGALAALALAAAALLAAAASTRAAAPQRVTVIGDSIATAVEYDATARAVLGQGVDLRLELAPCRRIAPDSCPYAGTRPPTLLDLVQRLGPALGPTVVVAVGYNDFEQAYADDIELALAALRKAGVARVLWLTLRAERHSYLDMNEMIRAAAARHPELTVVDWNLYSRSHPDWFQPDGLHLTAAGAQAMATLVHRALADLGVAPPPPAVASRRLPPARVGRPYRARLVARGGTRPYAWASVAGPLPAGLHLRAGGLIVGRPRQAGVFSLVVRVTDASRATASRRVSLRVLAS